MAKRPPISQRNVEKEILGGAVGWGGGGCGGCGVRGAVRCVCSDRFNVMCVSIACSINIEV